MSWYTSTTSTENLVEKSTILTESTLSSDTDTDTSITSEQSTQTNPAPLNTVLKNGLTSSISTLRDRYASALDLKEEINSI